jgi:hypothetical protein
MSDLSGSQNLLLRNGVWYYNRRVPSRLISIIGKRSIRASLHTSDKVEAKKRRALKDVEWDALFESAEANSDPAPKPETKNIAALVRSYVERKSAEMKERFVVDPPTDPEIVNERIFEADQTICILRDPVNPELSSWVTRVGDDKGAIFDFNSA